MRVNKETSVSATGSDISASVYMLRLSRAAQAGSLTFGPHRAAFLRVCAECAFPTESADLCSRRQINEIVAKLGKKATMVVQSIERD